MEKEQENREKSVRPQNKNLKTDAGPGRPKGQRNYATIYREALIKLAEKNNLDPDQLETEILEKAIITARKGDYRFYKDIQDRLHGSPVQKTDVTTNGKPINESKVKQLVEAIFNENNKSDSA